MTSNCAIFWRSVIFDIHSLTCRVSGESVAAGADLGAGLAFDFAGADLRAGAVCAAAIKTREARKKKIRFKPRIEVSKATLLGYALTLGFERRFGDTGSGLARRFAAQQAGHGAHQLVHFIGTLLNNGV